MTSLHWQQTDSRRISLDELERGGVAPVASAGPAADSSLSAEVAALANRLFPGISEKISSLNHLPNLDLNTSEEHIARLCFLTRCQPGSNLFPITTEDVRVCDASRRSQSYASRWLGWRPALTYASLAVANGAIVYLNYANISRKINSTEAASENQLFQDGMVIVASSIVGYVTSICGLFWTGRNTDKASILANNQQNDMHGLRPEFYKLATKLADLYLHAETQPLAVVIAQKINMAYIRERLNTVTLNEGAAKLIGLSALEGAVQFVRSGGREDPGDEHVADHVRIFRLRKNLETATQRIEELSAIVDIQRKKMARKNKKYQIQHQTKESL